MALTFLYVLQAGGQDPVSLTDMVELLASTGQSKGSSSKNREGDLNRAGEVKSELLLELGIQLI